MTNEQSIPVNWDCVKKKIAEKGWQQQRFATMMGVNRSWVANNTARHTGVSRQRLEQMALILGCSEEELKAKPTSDDCSREYEPSQFELDVVDDLAKIKAELATIREILMCLNNEQRRGSEKPIDEQNKDELETALETLKTLMENRQAIKRSVYMEEARKNNVLNDKIADAAIAKLGYHKKTTGYGNNKAVWIYKNVEL